MTCAIPSPAAVCCPMIGMLLGHTQVQTTARYGHLAKDPVKSAVNRIASRIVEVAG